MFPAPRIPTDKIPECRPHIERNLHRTLYRFSPSDYREIAEIAQRLRKAAGLPDQVTAEVNHGANGGGIVGNVKDTLTP